MFTTAGMARFTIGAKVVMGARPRAPRERCPAKREYDGSVMVTTSAPASRAITANKAAVDLLM